MKRDSLHDLMRFTVVSNDMLCDKSCVVDLSGSSFTATSVAWSDSGKSVSVYIQFPQRRNHKFMFMNLNLGAFVFSS
jgi:hypothetical protein